MMQCVCGSVCLCVRPFTSVVCDAVCVCQVVNFCVCVLVDVCVFVCVLCLVA